MKPAALLAAAALLLAAAPTRAATEWNLPTAYPVEQAVIDKNEQLFSNADFAERRSTNGVAAAIAQTRSHRSELQDLSLG